MTDIDVAWSADHRIAHIRLNRPETRNALDSAMLDRLAMTLAEISVTPSCRLVRVESAREHIFAVGADPHETIAGDGVAALGSSLHGQAIFDALSRLDVPVIAVIDGPALGDGFELALACDLRMASSRATFGLPATERAGGADWGGLSRLVPLVGPALAREMLSTGKVINAEEAMAMGLLTAVHPPERLAAAVAEITTQILDRGRLPLPIGKQIIDALSRIPAPGSIERPYSRPHPLTPSPSALGEGERWGAASLQIGNPSAFHAPLSRLDGRGAGGEGVREPVGACCQ